VTKTKLQQDDHYLRVPHGHPVELDAMGGRVATWHVYDGGSVEAVNAALAARRPLLLRGEPGVGKSQLARAVAFSLGRAFVSAVVDAHTEPRDLRHRFDAIRRLAKAQVAALELAGKREAAGPSEKDNPLDEKHFISPGPLWWAFQWETAAARAKEAGVAPPWTPEGWTPTRGCVVLIDEIDKADPSVPNGLLEALGEGRFDVPGLAEPVVHDEQRQGRPLVIVTTNEERRLPDAFLRRCMVLQMEPGSDLEEWLAERGARHFPDMAPEHHRLAARMLAEDRAFAKQHRMAAPGQAEYLDLLRAVSELASSREEQGDLLGRLRRYAYRKHPLAWPTPPAATEEQAE
jgi:MoxR-like ATPase